MIHKIQFSAEDGHHLSQRQSVFESASNFDYRNLVVNKPWGYEYLTFENEAVAVWTLFMKPDAQTSMHCHPLKKTALLVLSGEVEVSALNATYRLKSMDALLIDSRTFHSTKCLSKEGAIIMELETPPNKGDLVRLFDRYGRQDKGYEGIADISFEVQNYEYCFLEAPGEKQLKHRSLSLWHFNDMEDIKGRVEGKGEGLFCLLAGSLYNHKSECLLVPGEVMYISELNSHLKNKLGPTSKLSVLIIF